MTPHLLWAAAVLLPLLLAAVLVATRPAGDRAGSGEGRDERGADRPSPSWLHRRAVQLSQLALLPALALTLLPPDGAGIVATADGPPLARGRVARSTAVSEGEETLSIVRGPVTRRTASESMRVEVWNRNRTGPTSRSSPPSFAPSSRKQSDATVARLVHDPSRPDWGNRRGWAVRREWQSGHRGCGRRSAGPPWWTTGRQPQDAPGLGRHPERPIAARVHVACAGDRRATRLRLRALGHLHPDRFAHRRQ